MRELLNLWPYFAVSIVAIPLFLLAMIQLRKWLDRATIRLGHRLSRWRPRWKNEVQGVVGVVIGFPLVFGLAWWLVVSASHVSLDDFKYSDMTLYPVQCTADFVENRCPGSLVRLPRTFYTVYPEQQVVVSQSDGDSPTRLDGCAVVDRKNWSCGYVGVTDGEFRLGGLPLLPAGSGSIRYVSRSEWLRAMRPN
jgi:hypothetical protein